MQSKGMEDSPLKDLHKMEGTKLSNIEFKLMVIKIPKELTDHYKEPSENYNSIKKEIETITKNQEEMNNKISEIKNTLERITSRLDEAEDRISELEDKVDKNTQIIPKKQNTHSFKCSWNIFKDRPHDRSQNKPQQIQEN